VIAALPPAVYPWPIGVGPRYHPSAANPDVLAGRRIGRMTCANRATFDVHLELFASRQVAIVPPKVGVARSGCVYPLHTTDPTGVVAVANKGTWTLGDLFRVWGRMLGPNRLLSFKGAVSAFVGGRRWFGDPRRLVLREHAEIVLEVGGYVPPHTFYLFPKGGR
jgi:hypothetical protein